MTIVRFPNTAAESQPDIEPATTPPFTPRRARTAAARAGIDSDTAHGAVVPPIHLSSNYTFEGLGRRRTYDYSRSGNPTRSQLADALAEIEGGASGVVTASGMAAITLVLQLVPTGGTVVAGHDCYGGTYRLLTALERRGVLRCRFVDLTSPTAAAAIAEAAPRLVWIETPSNPLLRITDLRAVCAAARRAGAYAVVDNTFLSPALQQPLQHGADLVVHSTTKYINGHSDVVGGAVIARDRALGDELIWWANCLGVTGAPFDSFLTLRGVRTLFPRMREHEANAARVVELLVAHPAVDRVHYPGLPTHAGHALARRQQTGFGGMVSFELRPGLDPARVCEALRCFSLAESLGGVESLVAHPATMTHASMDEAARRAAGIGDGLLRLSIGIEDAEDLVADLGQALDGALASRPELASTAASVAAPVAC